MHQRAAQVAQIGGSGSTNNESLEHSPYQKDRQNTFAVNQPYLTSNQMHQHYSNKFSKSSTRKSSNNLNL